MKASIVVQNLKCGGCANTITSKIANLPNISNVVVDQDSAMVSFAYTHYEDALRVKDTLKTLGYPSIDARNSVVNKVTSFVSCATGKLLK